MLMYIKQEFVSKILQIIRIPPSRAPWVISHEQYQQAKDL